MTSCIDKYENIPKYQRPEWLTGKLYTQISNQDNMGMFTQMLIDTKYDEIIDKTGTYAAFVPNDDAMSAYLNKNGYSSVEDIPLEIKEGLVKFHILQMPWNSEQLQSLSSQGWISADNITNDEPTAFKRRTLYKEPNKTYHIKNYNDGDLRLEMIVPESGIDRTVFNDENKQVPLFFDDFLTAAGISGDDYTFYFGRAYEPGNIYYAKAKVLGDELFAENGFLYEIDSVVDVMPNAEEILKADNYSIFLDLINNFSLFSENADATNNQEGAQDGFDVGKLYNLATYLPINIYSEVVGSAKITLENNIGLIAPTNKAMEAFFDTYFKDIFSSWDDVSLSLKQLVLTTHMGYKALYEKDFKKGFFNYQGDEITYDNSKIIEKVYGSNCTFVGVNEVIKPQSFSKVSVPLWLDPAYYFFSIAFSKTDLSSVLTKKDADYSFFMIDDATFVRDSSLTYDQLAGSYSLYAFDHTQGKYVNLLKEDEFYSLRRRLYGHIGIEPILNNGATKEFIETIDGRHIQVYQESGLDMISGGQPAEYGFNSGRDTFITYSPYDSERFGVTNGHNYNCTGWLKFSQNRLYTLLDVSHKFVEILDGLGMADVDTKRTFFDDPSERYTLFLPSDDALTKARVDTLTDAKLRELVQFHIVRGDFIFTDGKARSGAYKTYNGKQLNISAEVDDIKILDQNGQLYTHVPYSNFANKIATATKNIDEEYYTTNVVVQPIDTVIFPY